MLQEDVRETLTRGLVKATNPAKFIICHRHRINILRILQSVSASKE